ncbi:MAG: hypothetical protein IKR57_03195 [Bacilli bacterium]|nr:hypothetical protein [Bacilli bacterium]
MKYCNIDEDTNNYLSYRLNCLISKLSEVEMIECIYISYFETFNIVNFNRFNCIGIDIVMNDINYYKSDSNKIITQTEIYTSAMSRILARKGYDIIFNIKSNKRSNYFKERSRQLDYLIRSEIVFDRYDIYGKLINNTKKIDEFSNGITFNPKLKLKKI